MSAISVTGCFTEFADVKLDCKSARVGYVSSFSSLISLGWGFSSSLLKVNF
jgi:hypothetical protein